MAVPTNYVPGLGRGATGFTTRSDIGPARMTPEMAAAQQVFCIREHSFPRSPSSAFHILQSACPPVLLEACLHQMYRRIST